MRKDNDPKDELLWEINITPLTDVFLVLLIIFMVATPFLIHTGLSIKLPKSSITESHPEGVVIVITEDNEIFVDNKRIRSDELLVYLKGILNRYEDKLVIIKGDRRVLLGNAVKVMDIAKTAGAERIALATEPQLFF